MKRRSKFSLKNRVYWPQSTSADSVTSDHDQFVDKMLLLLAPHGQQGVTEEIRSRYRTACRWLFESLYQAHYSIPSVPIALPKSKDAYAPDSTYGMPFGHTITTRVLETAKRCQFVTVQPGEYSRQGKGWVTRARPSGRLLQHFVRIGFKWKYPIPPSKDELIFLNEGEHGSLRRIATITDSKSVAGMRLRLNKINQFLSKQCIWLDLPNMALADGFKPKVNPITARLSKRERRERAEDSRRAISLQNVHLRRIFAQNSLERGGRFYGAWWQIVPKKLRRRIMINDDRTIEMDYSGLALNMLYAMEKVPLSGDPYDIGLQYTSKDDEKRRLVKSYVNAVLNDSSGKYQLSPEELAYLGLTHKELNSRVRDKHSPIQRHFNTGIGITLQYYDSEMAEKVITVLNAQGITCLPIHDSFIVPVMAYRALETSMKTTFQDMFGVDIDLKESFGFFGTGLNGPRKAIVTTVSSVESLIQACIRHQNDYTVMTAYRESWRSTNFSSTEAELQLRAVNIDHAIFKDRGLHSPYEHLFQGLYPLGRHL